MLFNLTLFLIASMIVAACSSLFDRFKLPQAALVIVIGVLLGPGGLNLIQFGQAEHVLSELAVILILFSAGYDINWSHFTAAIKPGTLVGVAGIVFSSLLGFAAAYAVSRDVDEALYVGIALSATSIGLSVALMHQAGVLDSKVGQILLAAAIVDDVLALYLLSATHVGLMESGGSVGVIVFSLLIGLLVLSVLSVVLWLLNAWMTHSPLGRVTYLRRAIAIGIALMASWLTASFELSPVVGAFVAGAVAAVFKNKFAESPEAAKTWDSTFYEGVSKLFAPLFFLAIGLQVAKISVADNNVIWYALLVTAAAIVGKLLAPWVLATVLSLRERWLLGFALLPRAEVALVVTSVGFQQGHLSRHAMMSLVLMTLVTAVIASTVIPVLVNHLSAYQRKNRQ